MARRNLILCTAAALAWVACEGGAPAPAPGTPAEQAGAPAEGQAAAPATEQGAAPTATGATPGAQAGEQGAQTETELQRETFAYRGSGRDPFLSLLKSGEARPLVEDLRVTTITYDPRYPRNSVAVLRDTKEGTRYTVRAGDVVGRLRIAQIREYEVVVVYEQFGVERQEVLRLRRRQEVSR